MPRGDVYRVGFVVAMAAATASGGCERTQNEPMASTNRPVGDANTGEPCAGAADCTGNTFCNPGTSNPVPANVCTRICSSDASCQGEGLLCVQGLCARSCANGCPEGAVCSSMGVCENASAPPAAMCGGVARPCEELTPTECDGAPACSRTGVCEDPDTDVFLFPSCIGNLTQAACRAVPGCYWAVSPTGSVESCEGTPLVCPDATTAMGCLDIQGCEWVDQGCTGGTPACNAVDSTQCTRQPGCSLGDVGSGSTPVGAVGNAPVSMAGGGPRGAGGASGGAGAAAGSSGAGSSAGGSTGGVTSAGGSGSEPLILLEPDATGWVDGATNAAGIQGNWFGFNDCNDSPVDCTTDHLIGGTPVVEDGPGFPNVDGVMCTTGVTAQVMDEAEFSTKWGAGIALELARPAGEGENNAPYDATAYSGFAFTLQINADHVVRANLTNPDLLDSHYVELSESGDYTAAFAEVRQGSWVVSPVPFRQDEILAIQFAVQSRMGETMPFDYCVSNLAIY